MLAYALVPPGLLAACGCGECACAAEDEAGKCCCSLSLNLGVQASAESSGLKPCCRAKAESQAAEGEAAASCQQNCSAQDACECSPTDGSQPASTAQTEVKQQKQSLPLVAFISQVDYPPVSRSSDIGGLAPLAPSPPLRILLCVWRN
jgi:hypothetical protein